MGKLLAVEGCEVRVIDLPGPEKGVDDFVVAQGQKAFDELYDQSDTLDIWQVRLFTLLNYQSSFECDRPFLGHIQIPDTERLIVLKSAKGTGKTEWLTGEVAKAHANNRRVLIITHRIQLGEALCDRFGVNYVTEVCDSGTGDFLGYGVCIDSLHHQSQARFNPNDWYNDTVIIDECDQVFWHLLNSGTEVAKRRVSVLKNLKSLVWGIFQGVQSANSVRQMLARLRETVDRHIWVRSSGIGLVGNGSTSVGVLLASQHAAARANIMLLSQADNADFSCIDENFQPESLHTWAKRACVINALLLLS